jgi:hypothetical protein
MGKDLVDFFYCFKNANQELQNRETNKIIQGT